MHVIYEIPLGVHNKAQYEHEGNNPAAMSFTAVAD